MKISEMVFDEIKSAEPWHSVCVPSIGAQDSSHIFNWEEPLEKWKSEFIEKWGDCNIEKGSYGRFELVKDELSEEYYKAYYAYCDEKGEWLRRWGTTE